MTKHCMKLYIAQEIIKRLPETLKNVKQYTEEATDLERTLAATMTKLSLEEFENFLHPAFQQDEWILITVGALLGSVDTFT